MTFIGEILEISKGQDYEWGWPHRCKACGFQFQYHSSEIGDSHPRGTICRPMGKIVTNTWERKKLNLKVDFIILCFRRASSCTSHLIFYPHCWTILALDSPPRTTGSWFRFLCTYLRNTNRVRSHWETQCYFMVCESCKAQQITFHEGKATAVCFWCPCLEL